ncbi:MAG TPA: Hsp20/alpha crystallin family protein [Thermoplasmata archaeon]|nr:Hsp20/alpha crystallin family protein [Thermoplasmata archaeon]
MGAEDEFEETRRAIHRMLKDAFEGKLGVFREPFIYGFTARSREARVEAAHPAVENPEVVTRDPLVDVILTESAIYLTAEMPGTSADDVRVQVDGGRLSMRGEGERRYFSSVDLPVDVDPDTLKHTFKNGVLDIVIARRRAPAP